VWSGWPAGGGRVVGLVLVARAPGNGRESKRFILAGYVNKKCILVLLRVSPACSVLTQRQDCVCVNVLL
jgi:hypothetical protein